MKSISFFLASILLLLTYNRAHAAGSTSLSGKITDEKTGEPIVGAIVYFPDLKTGTASKADGTYSLNQLPMVLEVVHVSFFGYESVNASIDLSTTTQYDFKLRVAVTELNTVTISGLSQAVLRERNPAPISVVTNQTLVQTPSTNIVDALAHQPGLAQIGTGPGISKPVIRGLGFSRVVVVSDGIRQEGQQWGSEHGLEVDEFGVDHVELLKGPASLAYGSDAMAGVINLLPAEIVPSGTINGRVVLQNQTNNGLYGAGFNCSGNSNGLVWDSRISTKYAHAYRSPYDGYVYGTKFSEKAFSQMIGLSRSWGYSHLTFRYYQLVPEIAEGERDSATGQFIHPFSLADGNITDTIASGKDFTSYRVGTPHQNIVHLKAVLDNYFILPKGRIRFIAGWQQNNRQEFGDVANPNTYGLYFRMNSFHGDLRYLFPEKNNLSISVGTGTMLQQSANEGTEFLVPAYTIADVAMYALARKSFEKFDVSGGLRVDHRDMKLDALWLDSTGAAVAPMTAGSEALFNAASLNFLGLSGSVGMTWLPISPLAFKLNFARGYRAPNIAELGSNGIHEGTGRYEIGNTNLKPEQSLQGDFATQLHLEHIDLEFALFNNRINQFIFLEKLESVFGGDSIIDPNDPAPAFSYRQANANLWGGEVMIDIHPHPLDWLHFENSFSWVNAEQLNATDSTKYLPFTPAPRLSSEIRAEQKKDLRTFRHSYFSIRGEYTFDQNKIYSAYQTETSTPGYFVLNAGFGTDFVSDNKTRATLVFSVTNITNVAYQNHLDRLKYTAVNNVTGRSGIFQPGRNFVIKLNIPIDFRKVDS